MEQNYIYTGDAEDSLDAALRDPMATSETSVVGYVKTKIRQWDDHIETNYRPQWEEFSRIWRGRWAQEDATRTAERSRIVTPATQQAVESSVCEIDEATFAHGKPFDIRDDVRDQETQDIGLLRKALTEEFTKNGIRGATSEVLINAAVFGTGIAEVVVEEVQQKRMGKEPVLDGQLTAYGVYTENKVAVYMKPILPKNFLIDPVATSVETAHGCVIDEFVSSHTVHALQKQGVYRPGFVGTAAPDRDLEPDPELPVYPLEDKVRIQKYFGLVPRYLITRANFEDETEEQEYYDSLESGDVVEDEFDYVEAIVVIANEGMLLKAEESPYMMEDRPVVAFQWDVVPGLFHGRGVVEKGYNPQKALDAEIRARIDALALTVHPMMGIDATRIPRGTKLEIRAGRNVLTNGNPKDVLNPMSFGNVDQITFTQAAELQKMIQQATGALDGAELAADMGSNNKTGAVSMVLGSIVKRQKRTLINFQESFWVPFVQKAAWRYMQFDPEAFPVNDYNFIPSSTLGIMAREYEVSQLVQLLQTTSDQSPMYGAIVTAIVDSMNIDNREELIEILKKAAEPDPEQVQMQRENHALDMQLKKGQVAYVGAQGEESRARAANYMSEARARPKELEIKKIDAITKNLQPGAGEDTEFTRRLKIAEVALKEREQNIKEEDLRLTHRENKRQLDAQEKLQTAMGDTAE